jgi:hypothetical protein
MSSGGGGSDRPASGAGGTVKTPSDFLKSIRGRPVVVKLNSGVDYRGHLQPSALFLTLRPYLQDCNNVPNPPGGTVMLVLILGNLYCF